MKTSYKHLKFIPADENCNNRQSWLWSCIDKNKQILGRLYYVPRNGYCFKQEGSLIAFNVKLLSEIVEFIKQLNKSLK